MRTVLLNCKAECKIYMYMLRADLRRRFACYQSLRMLARGVLVQHDSLGVTHRTLVCHS